VPHISRIAEIRVFASKTAQTRPFEAKSAVFFTDSWPGSQPLPDA
jgi:hypothetical protein